MKNQSYLKDWDEFASSNRDRANPILLPISVDINENGEITRERMRAPDVKSLYIRCKDKDIPDYILEHADRFGDAHKTFREYIDYFAPIDGAQGPGIPSPLDLAIAQPTWMLFHLPKNNWKFTVNKQYSVENDRDDLLRNFAKVCTMDDMNVLLLSNACLSSPDRLKFNLHVTVFQNVDGRDLETDIIIDPGTQNQGGMGSGGVGNGGVGGGKGGGG